MDDTFHRLVWITLVAVAFTFTVILTSVFVDIDDLLAKRTSPVMKAELVTEALQTELPVTSLEDFQEFSSNEEDDDENESTFRTKRSLESDSFNLHIKNPKIKKILTNRLATLLEELDEEDLSQAMNGVKLKVDLKEKNVLRSKNQNSEEHEQKKENELNNKNPNHDKLRNEIAHKDILHLAMHNVLLQGIMKHMDLNEVYKKLNLLIKSFDTNADINTKDIDEPRLNNSKPMKLMKTISYDSYDEEDRFLNELIKCEKLKKEILQNQDSRTMSKKETSRDPHNMFIKTIIKITNNNDDKENFKNSNENITGAIKLLYNGKEIKPLGIIDDKNEDTETVQNTHIVENKHTLDSFTEKLSQDMNTIKINQAVEEYLKKHSIKFHNNYNLMAKGSFITKRLKRQIKIRYLDSRVTTEKSKRSKEKSKHHDDELYVEIETHFDGKGAKGEKKKKLVRTIIDKIQKAINSNIEVTDPNGYQTDQQKRLQIRKRIQNPIDHNELTTSTISPVKFIDHRQLNPISKTANVVQPLTSLLDKSGETWKKIYNGPGFLTVSKSLNSAEMRELDIDYNSVMKNGIPERLQKPINTENGEFIKFNEYPNMGNVRLYLKDINGSGFSIGINQYIDEPPDRDTLKIFTGLENLIQAYQQNYDETEEISNETEDQADNVVENVHRIRRDINKQISEHSLEMNVSKDNGEKKKIGFTKRNRHKRGARNIKLFSNINSKTKLNKFINTNARPTKRFFLKSKRNKRQIDKIRIIASDRYQPNSREDIFLVSRENIYADRAIVKEEETPEIEIGDKTEEHFDFVAPYPYNIDIPNLKPTYLSNAYNTKALSKELLSKYPHIFLENIERPKKEFLNINPKPYGTRTINNHSHRQLNAQTVIDKENEDTFIEKNISSTNVDEIVNAVLPSRNNFKVVVKILPKNKTITGPGYKEVVTLINKSYNKNGLRYVSSLNVSEVSKFEKLNKSKEEVTPITEKNSEIESQQNQIKLLLNLHKERIDQQLEHLKMESQKLKQMVGNEPFNKNVSHLIDVFRKLELNKFPLTDNKPLIHAITISNEPLSKSEKNIIPLFSNINKQEHLENMKIFNLIKENENITKEILLKIDENTHTLQYFLQKLWNQNRSTHQRINTNKILTNDTPKFLVGDQVIDSFLEQVHRNFTNTIPFIYAFQHPLPVNNDVPINTVANVIYHGHIHANKVENIGKKSYLRNITNWKLGNNNTIDTKEVNNNETRFFIDELENDFKLVSNVNDRIPVLTPGKSNSTTIL